jgi:hypothetical protein
MPKEKPTYRQAYKARQDAGLMMPKVQGAPYGERGEEAPKHLGLTIGGSGKTDRMVKNPYEEEGFSHLRPHETEI